LKWLAGVPLKTPLISRLRLKGEYRIKLFNSDRYLHLVPHYNDPRVKLSSLDPSTDFQKWIIVPSHNDDAYTITSVYQNSGLIPSEVKQLRYRNPGGYKDRPSSLWKIKEQKSVLGGKFSKIMLSGTSEFLDSKSSQDFVHFYEDRNHENQRWVFQLLKEL
jgi:hypothetical protein